MIQRNLLKYSSAFLLYQEEPDSQRTWRIFLSSLASHAHCAHTHWPSFCSSSHQAHSCLRVLEQAAPLTLIPRPSGHLLPPESGLSCPSYHGSPFPHPILNCSVRLSCFNFLQIFEIILFLCLLLPRPPRM